jgi:DNA helicase-2/ATP-dependent DNA helicase PcrA
MQLNPRQQEAVTTTGIQCVLAGPGSGKTRVITEKIVHLIEQGAAPGEILALTFSDKAAREMAERLEKSLGTVGSDIAVHTFHSFCLQVLEDNVLDSGISFSSGIISRTNQLVWGLQNIDEFGFEHIEVGNNAPRVITSLIDGISRLRDELITPAELDAYLCEKECQSDGDDGEERLFYGKLRDLLRVYEAYERFKRLGMLLDFDDMIHETVRLFERKPPILALYKRRYRYILVDEFQDTNYAQLALIKQLAGDQLCVVGDDDQTIYRFRGAYFGNFDDFSQSYPDHRVTLLDENYRNSRTILAAALQLMAHAPGREDKALATANPAGETIIVAECENEDAEAHYVLQEIRRLLDTDVFDREEGRKRQFRYRDFAILCRRRADGVKFYQLLKSHGIPCEFSGEIAFFSMPEVRDMMAWLRAVKNPLAAGISLNRIMKAGGVPEAVVQTINATARETGWSVDHSDGVFEAMQAAEDVAPEYLPVVRELAQSVVRLTEKKDRETLSGLVYEVMMRTGALYRETLENDDGRHRLVLNRFYTLSKDYESITKDARVDDFLEYLSLLSDMDIEVSEPSDTDAVQILTLHKSKGKEFPVVFLVDLSERKFPLRYQEKPFFVPRDLARGLVPEENEKALHLQEERRLCYVGMTRAQERLYFTRAKIYGDNKRESRASVFLEELEYTDNPLITVIDVPAETRDIPVLAKNELEVAKHALQAQAIRAVVDMRLGTALQRMMDLEKVRLLEEGEDISVFDRSAFLAVPEAPFTLPRSGGETCGIGPEHGFSASALQTYEACPLQYRFRHVLIIPTEPKSYFGLGSVVHTVIEKLSADELKGIAPTRERARAMLDVFWSPKGYQSRKHEEEDRAKAESLLDFYLGWHLMNDNSLAGIEEKFMFTFDGRTMKGYIDRIERTPDGGMVVIDFKTGSKPGSLTRNAVKENIQLNLYCLAVRDRYGELPRRASFLYLKDNKRVDYFPDDESMEFFLHKLSGMIGAICAGEFPATPSYSACRFCDYTPLCDEQEKEL